MSWIIGIAVVLVLMVATTLRRGLQMRELVNGGAPIAAVVTKKIRFRPRSGVTTWRVGYRYETADGEAREHTVALGDAEAAALEPGATIAVVYLPHRPRVSAPASMVELARTALTERS